MAAASIGKPGTEYGPCAESCDHRDCAASRTSARGPCSVCHEPIGYDRLFYRDLFPGGIIVYTHSSCMEDKDRKRSKLKGEA